MNFRFKRMVTPAAPSPIVRITIPGFEAPTQSPPEAEAPRKKVLIVDDDPVTVRALSSRLKALGFSVVTACDGSQALWATRKEHPDVMMVDVHFPPDVAHGGGVPWNGFLLTQWLRRFDNARNTPVILISASDRAEYKKKASAVGATAFLPKPIDNETLLSSLDTALFNKSDSAPAPVAQPETDAQAQKTEPSTPVAAASAAAENAEKPTVEFGL